MNNKRSPRPKSKLTLHSETLRRLDSTQLGMAAGAKPKDGGDTTSFWSLIFQCPSALCSYSCFVDESCLVMK